MQPKTQTLDIEKEYEDICDRVDHIERQINDLVAEAEQYDPPEDEEDQEALDELSGRVAQLESELTAVRGYCEVLERATMEWNGTEIVMREITGQEARMVRGEAERSADKLGLDQEQANHIRDIEFLQRAVESTPPGAPDPSDIHSLPNRMFDWLHSRANALNSVGDFEMGNSSLRERLTKRGGSTSSSPQ